MPVHILQRCNLNFIIKMPDITDDCSVFHLTHMVNGNHVFITSSGNKNISFGCSLFHRDDFVAFHRCL